MNNTDDVSRLVEENELLKKHLGETLLKLHTAMCAGAFSLDRDVMDLNPLFEALRRDGDRVSLGKARECVRLWLAGMKYEVIDT